MNNTNQPLDPQVVNLAKAIRKTESNGNFQAKGGSGEYGAYQYTKGTWDSDAKKYGVNAQLEQATPQQQNEVAYKKLLDLKNQGHNPAQIASIWNSGQPEWEGKVGTNKYGVHYDVPKYVDSVTKAYQEFKAGNQNPTVEPNASTVPQPETQPTQAQTQKEGLIPGMIRGITQPVVNMLARPIQAGAQLLGASNEDINAASAKVPFYGNNGNLDMPTGGFNQQGLKDVGKAVGQGLQTVALGMPVGTLGKAVGMGATAGLGVGLEQDPTNLGGIAANTALGAGAGLIGGGLSKALTWLPKSLTSTAFQKMNPQQIEQILATKSIGSIKNILSQSEKATSDYGSQIGNILRTAPNKSVIRAEDVINNAVKDPVVGQKIMDSGLDLNGLQKALKLAVPTKKGLVDKFFSEGLSLEDLHRLNSNLGSNVFKTNLGQSPAVVNGKAIGALIYGENTKLIQKADPRLPKLFDEYSKEIQLQKVLNSTAKKSSGGLISWKDVVPFMAGSSLGGPLGGLGTMAAGKAINNPAVQFGAAKTIQGLNKATTPVLNRAGLLPSLIKSK